MDDRKPLRAWGSDTRGASLARDHAVGLQEPPWKDCSGGINFMDPDFALTVRMTDANAGVFASFPIPWISRSHVAPPSR